MENPLKYFAELRDPRVERNHEHLLEEVLLISIAAVLSGAESWNDIADCHFGSYVMSEILKDGRPNGVEDLLTAVLNYCGQQRFDLVEIPAPIAMLKTY